MFMHEDLARTLVRERLVEAELRRRRREARNGERVIPRFGVRVPRAEERC